MQTHQLGCQSHRWPAARRSWTFVVSLGPLLLWGACGGRTLGGFQATNDNGAGNQNGNTNTNTNANTGDWPPYAGEQPGSVGEPGWRDSTQPWVGQDYDLQTIYAIWSRPEAVYVVRAGMPESGSGGGPDDYQGQWRIFRNDGTGWLPHWESGPTGGRVGEGLFTGFPDGRLVVGGIMSDGQSDLTMIEADASQTTGYLLNARHVFVVDDALAYAATGTQQKLVRYGDLHWEPLPVDSPYQLNRVWAGDGALFGVGTFGTVVSLEESGWRVHDSGSVDDFSQVWGFSANDVWIASYSGQLRHWNGQTWSQVSWPGRSPWTDGWYSVEGMWGADGAIFFHSFWQLVRCESATLQCEEIAYWPCTPYSEGNLDYCEGGVAIQSMWGNSPDEVFLAVNAPVLDAGSRDNPFLLWYDGALFHWF